jgi:hypothetical protein
MNAEDVVVDDYAEREVVKHVGKMVPDVRVPVFATALGIEAIALGDTTRLMVSTDEVDAIGIAQLQAHQQRNGLDRKQSAVDIVTEEEVVCVRAEATDLEDLEHVEKLAVNVADDRDRRQYVHHIRLVHQLLLQLVAYRLDHGFRQKLLFVEPLDTLVEINRSYPYGGEGPPVSMCPRQDGRRGS